MNMKVEKIEGNYINQRVNGADKVYQEIPTDQNCKLTTMKNRLNDQSIADRLDNNILNTFKENPYTQPLDSFAY